MRLLLPAKEIERIEVLYGVETLGGPRNIVLDEGPDPPTDGDGEGKS